MRQTERQPDHTAHTPKRSPPPAAAAHHHNAKRDRIITRPHCPCLARTYSRDRSRVGGHKGECPVGDLLSSPNRGRKDTVQNGSGLPFWAYFFFPAGPVPLYILQDGPASLGARKVLRPICGRSGIFPATTKQRRRRWVCVSQQPQLPT